MTSDIVYNDYGLALNTVYGKTHFNKKSKCV